MRNIVPNIIKQLLRATKMDKWVGNLFHLEFFSFCSALNGYWVKTYRLICQFQKQVHWSRVRDDSSENFSNRTVEFPTKTKHRLILSISGWNENVPSSRSFSVFNETQIHFIFSILWNFSLDALFATWMSGKHLWLWIYQPSNGQNDWNRGRKEQNVPLWKMIYEYECECECVCWSW